MPRHPAVPGLFTSLGRARDERHARRALERELADYATPGQRDELTALMTGRGAADDAVAAILGRQARLELFRAG